MFDEAVLRQNFGDRSRQRRLAMIDVSDRAYVYVRLAAIKFLFRRLEPEFLCRP